jgi:hypothetical protein
MTNNIKLYQIAYNSVTLQQVQESGFLLLDNLSNERPDWYEYWPIRKFLLSNELEDGAWYGFFSPRFQFKTNLNHVDVLQHVGKAIQIQNADVVLFCPQPDMGANFLNVYEQAEVFDAGFLKVAQDFVQLKGVNIPLAQIVMDMRQIVFSNYFVAKPAFWREWFQWAELLFDCAEDTSHPLHSALTHNTTYSENGQRKVFLQERLASLLLTLYPQFKSHAVNPFGFAWSVAKFRNTPETVYINDALKRAYRDTGFSQYMDAFRLVREKIKAD